MISIIKKLSVLLSKLKERHQKRLVAKLRKQAEAIDVADEMFVKRVEVAESLYEHMVLRATDKCDESYRDANKRKEELFAELEALSKI